MPSGNMANTAWLALTVMTHNLGRAVGHLAGPDLETASAATLRLQAPQRPGACGSP